MSREESATITKNEIYKSAEWLIRKYGIENVSVDSIVERAGITKDSFYVHFKSKESLIASFLTNYINNLDINYTNFIDVFPTSKSSAEILIALVEKVVDILIYKVGYKAMRLVYEAQLAKTIDTNAVLDYNRNLYIVFGQVISKGVQQGEFKTDLSVDALVKHCVLAIRGFTFEWCIRYPDYDYKDQVLQHFQILLSGFKC